jgi:hypothetical protein
MSNETEWFMDKLTRLIDEALGRGVDPDEIMAEMSMQIDLLREAEQ